MASLTFNNLQQTDLFYVTFCKYSSSSSSFSTSRHHSLSHSLTFPRSLVALQELSNTIARLSITNNEHVNLSSRKEFHSSSKDRDKRVIEDPVKKLVQDEKNRRRKRSTQVENANEEKGPRNYNMRLKNNGNRDYNSKGNVVSSVVDRKTKNKDKKGGNSKVEMDKGGKESEKNKAVKLKVSLDMCSKKGDVIGPIQLYESAVRKGMKLGQHHYTVLLYLCSSAALGVVQPAKSGKGSRSLDAFASVDVLSSEDSDTLSGNLNNSKPDASDSLVTNNELLVNNGKALGDLALAEANYTGTSPILVARDDLGRYSVENEKLAYMSEESAKQNIQYQNVLSYRERGYDNGVDNKKGQRILVSEEIKKFALQKGLEIYEKMRLDNVHMNEAAITAVARMAMSIGNGDMAFDMVKQMEPLGINPKLRSYGPALTSFCNNGDVEKAFSVEKHMLEHGINPNEPELGALLRVSVAAGSSDKVYYILHKLRTAIRKVSHSTAGTIVKWFESRVASRVGKIKWDPRLIRQAIENRGGGWHGQGWLGRGKWTVLHTSVGTDGLCRGCGQKLAIIDLDPIETENFAESVASIAMKREKGSSFQKFQKWLDHYGPFEAVVDGANVGLFTQKKFKPSKVRLVANRIRQKLPSKKWPLIILHNKRLTGPKMDELVNKALIEKWKNANALYATPTGSNDDWYWLYAAIKFKCLIVTNDKMDDHQFQLLGKDFFPRWKERHQVFFSFPDSGPEFHMPPPYSVVIQESEEGFWHIPIGSEDGYEEERTWLCITRAKSHKEKTEFPLGN